MKIKKRKNVPTDGKAKKKSKIDGVKTRIPKTPKNSGLESEDDDKLENVEEHKAQLASLAKKDPEFYKFLQEEDADLLEFDESDIDEAEEELSSSSASADEADSTPQEQLKLTHGKDGKKIIDQKVVDYLLESFAEKPQPGPSVIHLAVNSFMACAARVGANIDAVEYTVNDERVFEEIVRCCFQCLPKALHLLLQPVDESSGGMKTKRSDRSSTVNEVNQFDKEEKSEITSRFRKWRKYHLLVKKYLQLLLLFLNELQTAEVIVATLKTLLQLVVFCVPFKKLTKNFIKSVVRIWSRRTEECKCVAFMVLCKLVRVNKNYYTTILKACYIAYVSNTRLITPTTWPLVTFMQKSFAEICIMHPEISYHYAFVYIRQIAIHLRNALIAKRKDLLQTIYNWQFIMCLYLWAHVVGKAFRIRKTCDQADGISELSYPLIQIVITAMKLYPSLRYFPFRLHCLHILITAQVNCKVFVNTLALSVELLEEAAIMIKKKPSRGRGSNKAVNFTCLIKMSKPQLEDAGFRQSALEALFKLQLEAAYVIRNQSFFAEMMVPLESQIRYFVKQCKNGDHARLFKSLSVTLTKHANYVADIVAKSEINLNDPRSLREVNKLLSSKESPLSKFYDSWKNVWNVNADSKEALTVLNGIKKVAKNPHEKTSKNLKEEQDEESEVPKKRKNTTPKTEHDAKFLSLERADSDKKQISGGVNDELRDLSLWDAD